MEISWQIVYPTAVLAGLLIGWKIDRYLAVGFIWVIFVLFEIFKH